MKKVIILFIALFIPLVVFSQDIDYAEFFIDTDPGFGAATPISVSATGSDISLDFSADITALQPGIHYLVIRARDDQGGWSQGANTVFYLVKSPDVGAYNVDQAEYFIDTDPGFGTAISIPVPTPGNDLTLQLNPGLESLDHGIHYIHFRARDVSGRWGSVMNTIFLIAEMPSTAESEIQQAEYFIDTDPGFGMAISIPVPTPGNDLTLQLSPGIESLDQGIHYIHFRARDVSGRWGSVMNTIFLIAEMPSTTESEIQQVEYFIDTDPGYGMGTPVTLPSAGSDLTIDFSVSLSGLDDGNHVLYIRAQNSINKWGQVYAEGFAYSATGIGDEEISSLFKIYPNPSSGIVQVEISDQLNDEYKIRLMDLNGKLLYETDCYNKQCELHLNLPGGMYLLNIESSERSITQKIILE